jgi:Ca2+-binding EF-hand superfamily protein
LKSADADAEHKSTFAAMDANHDGQLTADEFPAEQKRLLTRLLRIADRNGDGKLSESEFLAGLREPNSKHPLEENEDAQSPMANPDTAMERFDKNHDGKLSRDEFPEQLLNRLEGLFKRGDTDGDGMISKAELIAYQELLRKQGDGPNGMPTPGMEQMFKTLDKNGDGKLSREEIPADKRPRIAQMFDRLDKNHDGFLSEEEFVVGLKQFAPNPENRRRKPDNSPVSNKPNSPPVETSLNSSAGMAGSDNSMSMSADSGTRSASGASKKEGSKTDVEKLPRLFEKMDTDHDGRISKAEFTGQKAKAFDRLDTNHDGYLDADEIRAGRPNVK